MKRSGRKLPGAYLTHLRQAGLEYHERCDIRPYLTFRIGGTVRLLVSVHSQAQLCTVLQPLWSAGYPFLVIGGGSNLVFPGGLTEAVVVINRSGRVRRLDERRLRVDTGVRISRLLSWCVRQGAGGLEFLAGIPGSIGGAAAVNAGAFGRSLQDVLLAARILDGHGQVLEVGAGYFCFGYRDSQFKRSGEAILQVTLQVQPESSGTISERIGRHLEYRKATHPSYRLPSAGCFFKNPQVGDSRVSAGRLLDDCGMKETRVGDIQVSALHANFLINRGGATFAQLQEAERKIRARVFRQQGITLEREVIYVSNRGERY